MANILKEILQPPEWPGEEGHLADGDIHRLANGLVSPAERETFSSHLNQCSNCYNLYVTALKAEEEPLAETGASPKRSRFPLALAASIVICLLLAGGLYYNRFFSPGQTTTASLQLDAELIRLLTENQETEWKSPERIAKLWQKLNSTGHKVKKLEKVIMVAAYVPGKGLEDLKPDHIKLNIRIENNVAYLEVIKKQE